MSRQATSRNRERLAREAQSRHAVKRDDPGVVYNTPAANGQRKTGAGCDSVRNRAATA